jgi:hypothetical protein
MIGGYLFKLKLDVVKVFLSCLAATSGSSLVLLLCMQTVIEWSSKIGESPVTKAVVALLALSVFWCAVWLAILSLCLNLIAEVAKILAFAVSLFSTGGSIAGLFLYALIGPLSQAGVPQDSKLTVYLAIGIGVVMMLVAYAIGSANAGRAASTRPGRRVVGAVVTATAAEQPTVAAQQYHPTESRIATVVAESKNRVSTNAWISVIVGAQNGTRFDLAAEEMKIGRSSGCPIKISGDDEVGREHALIRFDGGRFMLHDLASKNFTYLNDTRVTDARQLMNGDRIKVGQTVLEFTQVGK